jgi:hypothetical protein
VSRNSDAGDRTSLGWRPGGRTSFTRHIGGRPRGRNTCALGSNKRKQHKCLFIQAGLGHVLLVGLGSDYSEHFCMRKGRSCSCITHISVNRPDARTIRKESGRAGRCGIPTVHPLLAIRPGTLNVGLGCAPWKGGTFPVGERPTRRSRSRRKQPEQSWRRRNG